MELKIGVWIKDIFKNQQLLQTISQKLANRNKNINMQRQKFKDDWGFPGGAVVKNPPARGFPGGAVVESLPANVGDTGSSPGLGGSHVPRSGWAREPRLLGLSVWSLCSTAGGAAKVGGPRTAMGSGPRSLQLEKALTQRRRPNTAKTKIIIINK